MEGPTGMVRPMRKVPALFEQAGQRRAHLPYKPGAAFSAEQRSIEPFVLGDMLEEPHPDLWGMFAAQISDRGEQRAHSFLEDLLDQGIFILIIAIERGPADHRPLGQLADGQRVEPTLLDQLY